MNSRERILNDIRKSKSVAADLPEFRLHFSPDQNLLLWYLVSLEKCGGQFGFIESTDEMGNFVALQYPEAKSICSLLPQMQGDIDIHKVYDPSWLEDVDVAIVKGAFGVSENAAVWFDEDELVHRALPFLAKHLIVVLNKEDLVANMHEAYNRINIGKSGYGVFIAGPSKTADIEQSLVVGAQGARSFYVVFVGK